jgi:hypothetical protein
MDLIVLNLRCTIVLIKFQNNNQFSNFLLEMLEDPKPYGLVFNSYIDFDDFMYMLTTSVDDVKKSNYFFQWRMTIKRRFRSYPINTSFHCWFNGAMKYSDKETMQIMVELIVDFSLELKRLN